MFKSPVDFSFQNLDINTWSLPMNQGKTRECDMKVLYLLLVLNNSLI